MGIFKPSTSSSHLRLLYNSCRVALSRTQFGDDFGLCHPGNPRACTPSGQLQTMLEHHYPAPAQLILHGGQMLVDSGHRQSLQLTGPGKSLPLTWQQQSRLNYKRRVYSAHMKGTPRVPSLGHSRCCGTCRIPATLGHATKTRSHSSST